MGQEEKKLLLEAQSRFTKIFPCGRKKSFTECFTKNNDTLYFWFDTEDESTHLLMSTSTAVFQD